jgi:hypothetical protein
MRTEIQEPACRLHASRPRLGVKRSLRALEPMAVDAALAEESSSIEPACDSELLETLSQQLDILREQERSIRRLLDRAGHRRVDAANA